MPQLGERVYAELTAKDITKWRDKQYRHVDEVDDEAMRRRKATANRTLTILKAALNAAWRDGKIASDDAWRRVGPFKEADAARVRYLSIDENKRLINAAQDEFRDLVRAALATGCRYGELAALRVSDFNRDSGTVHIRASKTSKDRHVVLNDEGIALFTRLAAGRPGVELMLRKAGGDRWGKSNQDRPIAEASARAGIEPPPNFHCLRHTWASHAVMSGAPLMVAAKNMGHADTRMVEKHYGHLAPSYIADAIRAAAPRFGIKDESTIAPLAGVR